MGDSEHGLRRALDAGAFTDDDGCVVAEALELAAAARAALRGDPDAARVGADLDERLATVGRELARARELEASADLLAGARAHDPAALAQRAVVASARLEAGVAVAVLRDEPALAAGRAADRAGRDAGEALADGDTRRPDLDPRLTIADVTFLPQRPKAFRDAALRSDRDGRRAWAVARPDDLRATPRTPRPGLAVVLTLVGGSSVFVAPVLLVLGLLALLLPVGGVAAALLGAAAVTAALAALWFWLVAGGRLVAGPPEVRLAATGRTDPASRSGDLAERAVLAGLVLRRSRSARRGGRLWALHPDQVHHQVWDACVAATVLDAAPVLDGGDPPALVAALAALRVAVTNLEVAAEVVTELDREQRGRA